MSQIKHYGLSYIGRRKNNEDAILQLKVDENTWCFAVADGMGGAEGGEVASNEVITQVKNTLKAAFSTKPPDPSDLKKTIEKIFSNAQDKIAEIVQQHPELNGMGTTLTLLLIHQERYVWGNIGDSRIYLAQGNSIKQITNDHTYIEQYKQEHKTEVPESVAGRYGNIITRAISGNDDKPDVFPEDKPYETLQKGDVFLLCSDGLITSKIADSGTIFLPYLYSFKKLKTVTEQLVARAFNDGSSDNISTVVVINGKKSPVKVKKPAKLDFPPKTVDAVQNGTVGDDKMPIPIVKNFLKTPLKLVALLLTIVLVVLGYLYINSHSDRWFGNKSTPEAVVAKTRVKGLPTEQKKLNKKTSSSIKTNANITTNVKAAPFNVEELEKLRKESLIGISKLLVTFLNDSAVRKAHKKEPLAFLIKTLQQDKPDHLKDIIYLKVGYDSAGKLVKDTNNPLYQYILADTSKTYPYFLKTGNLLFNKANKYQYVIIRYGNLDKITSEDYASNMPVFARESGLKSLTILMAGIYIKYYHPANLKRDLNPLLQYLVDYNEGTPITSYGNPIKEGFEEKAKTTQVFYIQHLMKKDNKEFIDICVPIPNKRNQVLRAGYLIN